SSSSWWPTRWSRASRPPAPETAALPRKRLYRGDVTRYAVVGGGILGCAVAREILRSRPGAEVTLIEKEDHLAAPQSGHNSGVVHAGLFYPPGSLKARLCRRGVALLGEYCTDRALPYLECGKVLIARDAEEHTRLRDIAGRARANGVPGVELVGPAGL